MSRRTRTVQCCADGHCGKCVSCELDTEVKAHDATKAKLNNLPLAHFINEGVTLVIQQDDQHAAIEVTDDNRELCESIAKAFPAVTHECPEGF